MTVKLAGVLVAALCLCACQRVVLQEGPAAAPLEALPELAEP